MVGTPGKGVACWQRPRSAAGTPLSLGRGGGDKWWGSREGVLRLNWALSTNKVRLFLSAVFLVYWPQGIVIGVLTELRNAAGQDVGFFG